MGGASPWVFKTMILSPILLVQILLVLLRVNGNTLAAWGLILIPLWCAFFYIYLLFFYLLARKIAGAGHLVPWYQLCAIFCILSLLLLFAILLAVYLDNVSAVSAAILFSPLLILASVVVVLSWSVCCFIDDPETFFGSITTMSFPSPVTQSGSALMQTFMETDDDDTDRTNTA